MSVDCDVLICGLGPVGQLLALLLDDLGVSVIAFEKASEPYDLPRAAVIDDEVLRIFQAAGVDEEIMQAAQAQTAVTFVDARGRATEVFRLEDGELGHPPLVSIHQPSFERVMVAALERRGVDLRWGRRLDSLDRRAEDVSVWVRPTASGPTTEIRARYLVGCDGARSAVRSRLGIAFGGSTFAQRWLVVDGLLDRPLAKAPHPHFVGDPARPVVCLPMSPGRHRWEWMVHPHEDAQRFLDPSRIRALMRPWIGDERVEVERAVVYTFHARRAERWRRGRVLLAGDAAHVMPPFVGQGFSSGARDAGNLAWKLDAVLRGAPQRLLDTYQLERCRHVTKMQNFALRWGAIVQTRQPRLARLRDAAIAGLGSSGALDWLQSRAKPLPTAAAGAFATRPRRLPPKRTVGALFPQPTVDGTRLDERLGNRWGAVSATPVATRTLRAAGVAVVELHNDPWLERNGVEFALLRPDRYVFACGAAAEAAAAADAARRLVGSTLGSAVIPELEAVPA
jgi:3-(3-hydroxy-phenyl)propionate hydroxylase